MSQTNEAKTGKIFDIQRFSIHDGPGIRTILFMKGCSLRCAWCCNPESIKGSDEISFSIQDCIRCNKCIESCPYDAVTQDDKGRYFDLEKCNSCSDKVCATVCNAEAIVKFGNNISVDDAVAEIMKDEIFYKNSGGGVTFSGGEALLQSKFIRVVMKECKKRGLNTAVETAGNCPWENFEDVMEYTDLFLFDIKQIDPDKFKEKIGEGYDTVLENISKLSKVHDNIIIRTPVIPGFNDEVSSIEKIIDLTVKNGINEIHLLPFHRLGQTKYDKIFTDYEYGNIESPDKKIMEEFQVMAEKAGLNVRIGG